GGEGVRSAPFHTSILPALSTACSLTAMSSSLRASSTSSVRSNSKRSARYDTRPSRCSQASVCATTSENFIRGSPSADALPSQYASPSRTDPQQHLGLWAIAFPPRQSLLPYVGGLSLPDKEYVLALKPKRLSAAVPWVSAVFHRHTAYRHTQQGAAQHP